MLFYIWFIGTFIYGTYMIGRGGASKNVSGTSEVITELLASYVVGCIWFIVLPVKLLRKL